MIRIALLATIAATLLSACAPRQDFGSCEPQVDTIASEANSVLCL